MATYGPQPDLPSDEVEDWEIDNPLFWNNLQDNNEAYDGLLQLKEDCTPEERANTSKEQGNDFFALGPKKYDAAVYCYTQGLQEKFDDLKLRTVLHANRAAVNLKMKNYGKVIADCKRAISYDKTFVKAYFRAAQAAFSLKKYPQCIEFCNSGLELGTNAALSKLLKEATTKYEAYLIVEKKRKEEQERKEHEKMKLLNAISDRKLVMGKKQHLTSAQFRGEVHWDEEGFLRWPVVFAYPEHSQCDFIESMGETDRLIDHLEMMFPGNEFVFWDTERKYIYKNLCVYYQTNATDIEGEGTNYKKKVWKEIDLNLTLLEALQLPEYIIPEMPIFTVFVKKSSFLKEFLEKEKE